MLLELLSLLVQLLTAGEPPEPTLGPQEDPHG